MEELIKKVVDKVRTIYKYIPKYNDILLHNAQVEIMEFSGKFEIRSIKFSDGYNRIIIKENGIVYYEYDIVNDKSETILTFDSYEDFLNM